MASNLTNEGQQYALETAFRGAARPTAFFIGLTNASLTKTSVIGAVGATEPLGAITAPGASTAALAGAGAGNLSNGVYSYKVTFVSADGETQGGTASGNVTVVDNATNGKVSLTSIPTGSATVTSRKVYRTQVDGSSYFLLTTIADNTTTTYTDNTADGGLGAAMPTTNSTGQKAVPSAAPSVALAGAGAGNLSNGNYQYKVTFVAPAGETEAGPASSVIAVVDNSTNGRVALSSIPLGGAGVTQRKIYRTAVNGTVYKLLTTIADNTTTTYQDNIADGSLGADAPTMNTTAPNGYQRYLVEQSSTGWVTSALDAGDWELISKVLNFLAENAEGIGPVSYAFLCESASGSSGRLFGFWQLSQTRTMDDTEDMDLTLKIKDK